MDNSTPAPDAAHSASDSSPSASAAAHAALIRVTGILFDRSANHPIDSADIELRAGNARVLALTKRDGSFQVDLPRAGDWKIGPDKTSYPGFYDFLPTTIAVRGPGDVGTIEVDSDTAANARALEKAVRNIFISGEKLFVEGMKKYAGDPNLSELDVKTEAALAFQILSRALQPLVESVSEAKLETRLVELEARCEEMDKEMEANGEALTRFTAGICCTTCQRRYGSNQALLQKCLCCPQSCDPC